MIFSYVATGLFGFHGRGGGFGVDRLCGASIAAPQVSQVTLTGVGWQAVGLRA